ncbi:MAG: putative sugar O-methyltransferase [Rhodobiaceae bacterium]|nr:putative sugar O-methyltransferase [Rhodobiaceae bacterium]
MNRDQNPKVKKLFKRLEGNPDDAEAALKLGALLLKSGSEVPLNVREISLRYYLENDPTRDDLAFQLATVLMEQNKPIEPELELAALRHNVATNPEDPALLDRYSIVSMAALIQDQHEEVLPAPTSADYENVKTAKRNLAQASHDPQSNELPTYGIRWNEYAERTRRDIDGLEDPVSVLRFAQENVGFEHRSSAAQMLRHHSLYEQELRGEFPQFADRLDAFDDPPHSSGGTQIQLAGRRVSNIVPYLSRVILSCLTLLPKPDVILELGGGYGAPARLWLTNKIAQPKCYIIADIPESLFFAEVFLRTTFGTEAVHYVEDGAPIDKQMLDRFRVILCPIPHLASLEKLPVDLIVNTGSLQEMSEEWIAYYMEWLDRQRATYFYSLNYAAQPLNYLAESINLWSPRPSPQWQAKLLRMNPAFIRMQADRNFLESVYAKVPAALSEEAAHQRLDILEEQALTVETFIASMDVFRRCLAARIGFRILSRAANELPFAAKEMLWLAGWVSRNSEGLSKEELQSACDLLSKLDQERTSGTEGIAH